MDAPRTDDTGRGRKLVALVFGGLFGFWLAWTGFIHYRVILDALLFRDGYLWMMFPAAVATGFVGLRLLRAARAGTWVGREPVAWSVAAPTRDHVIGALLFGVGWALAGACPGPAVAQIAHGQLAGLFTTGGIVAGGLVAGLLLERRVARGGEAPLSCAE